MGGKEEDAAADEHAQQQMAELQAEIRIKDALIQSLQAQLARYGAAHASAPAPFRSLSPKAVAKNTFVVAAAVVPGAMFLFSSRPEHKYSGVELSRDRLTVTRPRNWFDPGYVWARSERGAAPGCGVVRWALRLWLDEHNCDDEAREDPFKVGIYSSDYFSGYAEDDPVLCHYFENQCFGADVPWGCDDVHVAVFSDFLGGVGVVIGEAFVNVAVVYDTLCAYVSADGCVRKESTL